MQYVWEVGDITRAPDDACAPRAHGTVVSRGPKTEHMLVGYTDGRGSNPCLVSLRDGMVCHAGMTPAAFVEMLNTEGFRPVPLARPMVETIIAK